MKQKNLTLFIAIFSFIILNTMIAFSIYRTKFVSKDIVRLHVVANSNSIEDQIIKLKIESKISDYISSLDSSNKTKLLKDIKESKDNLLSIADSTINETNKTYTASLKVGKIYYEEKQNMILDMYNGTYDSANIILGEGNGKNIWSIIFPNEKTIDKIKELDTILPGISNIYSSRESINNNDKKTEIKSKIFPSLGLTL